MLKHELNTTAIKESVSIIIPLHNRKELLKRALYSVLNQTILPFEILICDDGSDDNPQNIMTDFEKQYFKEHRQIYYVDASFKN